MPPHRRTVKGFSQQFGTGPDWADVSNLHAEAGQVKREKPVVAASRVKKVTLFEDLSCVQMGTAVLAH